MDNLKYMVIPPRHQRALAMLVEQMRHDVFGGIGTGALRDDDDPLTLEQIVQPLWERGLIEDLTQTEMGERGKYFMRITLQGQICHSLGYMLKEPRKATMPELKKLKDELPSEAEERAAIEADSPVIGTA